MSTFTLSIDTDNAAFEDNDQEVVRILHEVAERLAAGFTDGPIRDSNGNTVGTYALSAAGA